MERKPLLYLTSHTCQTNSCYAHTVITWHSYMMLHCSFLIYRIYSIRPCDYESFISWIFLLHIIILYITVLCVAAVMVVCPWPSRYTLYRTIYRHLLQNYKHALHQTVFDRGKSWFSSFSMTIVNLPIFQHAVGSSVAGVGEFSVEQI